MREIKFRAWDKKRSEMVYFDLPLLADESLFFYDEQIKNNDVMQFTGLHDKNGREIYEGDIVKNVGTEEGVHWYEIDDIEVVEISAQGVTPCGDYDCDCGTAEQGSGWIVVGNIHENPEPLEARP